MEQGCARCTVELDTQDQERPSENVGFRKWQSRIFRWVRRSFMRWKIDKVSTYELNGVCSLDCQNNGKFKDGKCVCVGKFSGERCENIDQVIESTKLTRSNAHAIARIKGSAWKVCVCATKVSTGPTARSRSHAQTARRNAPVNQNARAWCMQRKWLRLRDRIHGSRL